MWVLRGTLIMRMRWCAKHSHHLTTPEIHKKSSETNDLENEPGHVGRLAEVAGVTGMTFGTTGLHKT